jgi:hypothetical protein
MITRTNITAEVKAEVVEKNRSGNSVKGSGHHY